MFTFEKLRNNTPAALQNCYLETPARGLMPRYVSQKVIDAILGWQNLTPGVTNEHLSNQVKEKLAKLLQVSIDELVMTSCTAHGFNLLANAMKWSAKDNIVIPACEHPNNYYPWMHLKRYGVDVRLVPCCNGLAKADQIAKYTDKNTRIIAASLVSFYPGAYLEIEKFAEIARKHQARLVLDAIQAIGFRPVYPQQLGVDALASAAYKGLMSPHGSGLMYLSSEFLAELEPPELCNRNVVPHTAKNLYGDTEYDFVQSTLKIQSMPAHLAGLAAMDGALDIILDLGIKNIYHHLNTLTRSLAEKLNAIGLTTALKPDDPLLSHIVCADRNDNRQIVEYSNKHQLFLSDRREGIRLGLHAYNNLADIDKAVQIIGDYLQQI